ncbi:MAG: hypothetical protein EKK46_04200 [Rhodocyclaceae bacterium]|nr:MAG: hypothetical protein EKK46_04200 [Rhodocyclaceae bacterium]
MNKITHVVALAAIASVSLSAGAVTTGLTTPATAGANTVALTATTDTSLVGGGLKENVNLQLSNGNIAVVDYNPTANAYGYAVGSTKGKGKVYSGTSGGGAITETATTGGAVPTAANCSSAAGLKSGSTS